MKVVFIAGPFRADTQWGIVQNVRAAETAGLEVARLGAMPLIPHMNTANFHGQLTDEFWLEGTQEMLRRCDAVYVFPGARVSSGVAAEVAEADRRGIPVFTSPGKLLDWIRRG